jgi:DNA gyrase subunit A
LIGVELTDNESEILLANKNGRAIRFSEAKVRQMGRVSTGVRGMTLDGPDDEVIGLITMNPSSPNTILALSEKGIGKRSALADYRVTNRGGKGVKTINKSEKTGELVTFKSVNDDNDLVIINKSGITLRIRMADIPVRGRATMGVKIIDVAKRNDVIASACCVPTDPEEEVESLEIPGLLDGNYPDEAIETEEVDEVEDSEQPEDDIEAPDSDNTEE